MRFEGNITSSMNIIPEDVFQIEEEKHLLQGVQINCYDEYGHMYYIDQSLYLSGCNINNDNSFDKLRKFEFNIRFTTIHYQIKIIGYFIFEV